jgi:hypothetical protein
MTLPRCRWRAAFFDGDKLPCAPLQLLTAGLVEQPSGHQPQVPQLGAGGVPLGDGELWAILGIEDLQLGEAGGVPADPFVKCAHKIFFIDMVLSSSCLRYMSDLHALSRVRTKIGRASNHAAMP